MIKPHAYANSGYLKDPPVKINPGERKVMSAHKGRGRTGKIRCSTEKQVLNINSECGRG